MGFKVHGLSARVQGGGWYSEVAARIAGARLRTLGSQSDFTTREFRGYTRLNTLQDIAAISNPLLTQQ